MLCRGLWRVLGHTQNTGSVLPRGRFRCSFRPPEACQTLNIIIIWVNWFFLRWKRVLRVDLPPCCFITDTKQAPAVALCEIHSVFLLCTVWLLKLQARNAYLLFLVQLFQRNDLRCFFFFSLTAMIFKFLKNYSLRLLASAGESKQTASCFRGLGTHTRDCGAMANLHSPPPLWCFCLFCAFWFLAWLGLAFQFWSPSGMPSVSSQDVWLGHACPIVLGCQPGTVFGGGGGGGGRK